MVVSAATFKEVTNGYEQRTDGLWVHLGRLNVGGASANPAIQSFVRGQTDTAATFGLAVQNRSQTKNNLAVRDDGMVFADSLAVASTLSLPAGSVTSAMIADGTIATADLAANAATVLLGQYAAIPTFSTTAVGTFVATPISVSAVTTGAPLRIAGWVNLYHSVVGARVLTALAVDTVIQAYCAEFNQVTANYMVHTGFDYFHTPAAGAHAFTLYVYSGVAGTLTISGGTTACLNVVEHKR